MNSVLSGGSGGATGAVDDNKSYKIRRMEDDMVIMPPTLGKPGKTHS